MTITVVQAPNAFADATSGNFAADVTAGNTVFLVMNAYALSNVTISTSNPTFGGSAVTGAAKLEEQQSAWDGTLTAYTAIWMLPDVSGGSEAVAITLTNGSVNGNTGLYAYEVSGLGTSPALDQSAGSSAASGVASSGSSGNITQSPEIVIGGCAQNSPDSFGQPGGFTGSQLGASIAGYEVASSSGTAFTYDPSAGGEEWAAAVVTVYAGSGGQTVSLTAPGLALAAPLPTPQYAAQVSLTTPGLALAAPAVTPAGSGAATIDLTTPGLALAAPLVRPVTPATSGQPPADGESDGYIKLRMLGII